jgi:hypothetical protein
VRRRRPSVPGVLYAFGGFRRDVRHVPAVGGEVGVAPQGQVFEEPGEGEGEQGDERADQEDGVE